VDISLEMDWQDNQMKIPVKVEVEPERIRRLMKENEIPGNDLERLVNLGLRAQMKTANLITGSKYIALDFFENADPASIVRHEGLIELPTIPASLDELTEDLTAFLDRLSKIPIEEIGSATLDTIKSLDETSRSFREAGDGITKIISSKALQNAIKSLDSSLAQIQNLTLKLEQKLPPAIDSVSEQTITTLEGIEKLTGSDSDIVFELKRTLKEFARAAKGISRLADHLERHPESIIQGKGKE
jgi:paraquat-inducible protein B